MSELDCGGAPATRQRGILHGESFAVFRNDTSAPKQHAEKVTRLEKDARSKDEQLARIIDDKSYKIAALEQQIRDIAYGSVKMDAHKAGQTD